MSDIESFLGRFRPAAAPAGGEERLLARLQTARRGRWTGRALVAASLLFAAFVVAVVVARVDHFRPAQDKPEAPEKFTLRFVPRAGEKLDIATKVTQGEGLSFDRKLVLEYVAVGADGKATEVRIDGKPGPLSADDPTRYAALLFPAGPVAVGDTWKSTQHLEEILGGLGPVEGTLTAKLKEVVGEKEARVAVVTYEVEAGVFKAGTLTLKGEARVSVARGLVESAGGTGKMSLGDTTWEIATKTRMSFVNAK